MRQVNIQIGSMPIGLGLRLDGSVVLWPLAQPWRSIIDQDEATGKNLAVFLADEFCIFGEDSVEEFSYHLAYMLELYPALKAWLQNQNLHNPLK